ncbi:MAG: dihydropteroate synthase [Deltaproteobacteria bacterium]|nr:dihydropteroate synthase [Deltaproteobacteria bacterium]
MNERDHIPLGVGFYPDWWYKQYGISFDRDYYFDPETRVAARMEMDRRLYERFGEVGLGVPDPKPKPLITFGMVMLPALFGCEIVYEKEALPWAVPLNLSEDRIKKLEVPDLLHTYPMTEVIKQIDYLKNKYGKVVGDINTTGVQNLALKIRGEQLYFDYFENPALCHHLLKICTASIIRLFRFIYDLTGSGAMDVTPMCDPGLFVLPNCTVEQISLQTYETFNLPYDNQVAEACHPLGIHHCGSVDQALPGYAQVHHLKFLEIGFGSDVKRTRQVLGPDVAINARISPVLMKNSRPEEVAAEVRRLIDQGAPLANYSIDTVGLTYGTPDENVKAALKTAAEYGTIRKQSSSPVFSFPPSGSGKPAGDLETLIKSPSQTVTIGPAQPLVIIGERINPTGRIKLARALEEGDLKKVQKEAGKQVKAGARILDVNVGISGIDEPRLLSEAVQTIQEVTDVPLCLDSALPRALEAGLAVYQGKALVNSVNGEKRKLEQILPLVKGYGAAVIGLTMDDKGIPRQAETRLAIARRILEGADEAGIPREDVIIDPLAMAVSADHQSGLETLRAMQLIRDVLGVNQTLGLSNISFGLPERSSINALFLAMAVLNGLTCAIADPTDKEIKKVLLLTELLLGKDEFCQHYLAFFGNKDRKEKKGHHKRKEQRTTDIETLESAVMAGQKNRAVELTQKALAEGADPQDLINRYLIPALNKVGDQFEKREIFVPEMMIAAKTMQACLDLIRPLLRTETAETLGTIVLGTVFGDLHDIGKNLTKLLLESSGFKVIDLGVNVPSEKFVEAARAHKAEVVGLSSLLTTGDPFVEETVKVIRQSDLSDKVKVVCGGAALTLKFVMETCGAQAYAKDAADGVRKIKTLLGISI